MSCSAADIRPATLVSLAEQQVGSHSDRVGLAKVYNRRTETEVNARQLNTPCTQVDLVSKLQPTHYSRTLHGDGMPWGNRSPERGGYAPPTQLHPKPFNAYGSPVKGPRVNGLRGHGGMAERDPEPAERTGDYLFRGERRSYLFDEKWSRAEKHAKFVADDGIFNLRPHSELFCSKTALQERWPSEQKEVAESGDELLWAPNQSPDKVNARRKMLRERPMYDPTDIRNTKYSLYRGPFDKAGTKSRHLPGDIFSGTVEPARPRWGYCGKATVAANDSVRRTAAHQRSFDLLRPRNNWSCPEMGYHFTYRD